jgi:adenylate cyclase class 2
MIEVEIKLAIGPANLQVPLLENLGATLVHPRSHEENILLDLPGMPLMARGAFLRVRKFGETHTLTFKEPTRGSAGYKVRRELETGVDSAGDLLAILESTGFRRVWKYEKFRTVYHFETLEILVDETPIGNYLELEGSAEAIDSFAGRLGFSPSDYIASSYRSLYEGWCHKRGLAVGDLTFQQGTPT